MLHKESTSSCWTISFEETSSNSNERVDWPYRDEHESNNCSVRPEDTETLTQYFPNIDSEIAAKSLEQNQNDFSSDLYDAFSQDNDNTEDVAVKNVDTSKCVAIQPSEDRHVPEAILKLFPRLNEQQVIHTIKQVQDKTDNIWEQKDQKCKNYQITPTIATQMWHEFQEEFRLYLYKTFFLQKTKIKDAIQIFERSSFGILFVNTTNEILGVQNPYGLWSAPKGHSRINENSQLEIPWETSSRETCEEVSIELKRSKRKTTINKGNIGHFLDLNKAKFLQCRVSSTRDTSDASRLIGLFIVHVDERKWKFTLKDKKENKACEWLKMDDILNDKPEKGRDIYHTLRPFVEYLKKLSNAATE